MSIADVAPTDQRHYAVSSVTSFYCASADSAAQIREISQRVAYEREKLKRANFDIRMAIQQAQRIIQTEAYCYHPATNEHERRASPPTAVPKKSSRPDISSSQI